MRGQAKGTLGENLDETTVEMLNDAQTVQLYELMKATKGLDDDSILAKK